MKKLNYKLISILWVLMVSFQCLAAEPIPSPLSSRSDNINHTIVRIDKPKTEMELNGKRKDDANVTFTTYNGQIYSLLVQDATVYDTLSSAISENTPVVIELVGGSLYQAIVHQGKLLSPLGINFFPQMVTNRNRDIFSADSTPFSNMTTSWFVMNATLVSTLKQDDKDQVFNSKVEGYVDFSMLGAINFDPNTSFLDIVNINKVARISKSFLPTICIVYGNTLTDRYSAGYGPSRSLSYLTYSEVACSQAEKALALKTPMSIHASTTTSSYKVVQAWHNQDNFSAFDMEIMQIAPAKSSEKMIKGKKPKFIIFKEQDVDTAPDLQPGESQQYNVVLNPISSATQSVYSAYGAITDLFRAPHPMLTNMKQKDDLVVFMNTLSSTMGKQDKLEYSSLEQIIKADNASKLATALSDAAKAEEAKADNIVTDSNKPKAKPKSTSTSGDEHDQWLAEQMRILDARNLPANKRTEESDRLNNEMRSRRAQSVN